MFTPMALDAMRVQRGHEMKRYVRAAAAMRGIFEDRALATRAEVSERTVSGWWRGAVPKHEALDSIARTTGLARDELVDWLYYDGPPPRLPGCDEPEEIAVARLSDPPSEPPQDAG